MVTALHVFDMDGTLLGSSASMEVARQLGTLAEHIKSIYSTALTMHEPLPDVWQLAQNFGLSTSTFKRRLAEEGISAGAVKDEWRRDRAIQEESLADTLTGDSTISPAVAE